MCLPLLKCNCQLINYAHSLVLEINGIITLARDSLHLCQSQQHLKSEFYQITFSEVFAGVKQRLPTRLKLSLYDQLSVCECIYIHIFFFNFYFLTQSLLSEALSQFWSFIIGFLHVPYHGNKRLFSRKQNIWNSQVGAGFGCLLFQINSLKSLSFQVLRSPLTIKTLSFSVTSGNHDSDFCCCAIYRPTLTCQA